MTKTRIYITAVGIWFVFLLVAFTFGTLREIVVTPLIGKDGAHVVGTLAVVTAFVGIMVFFVRRFKDRCSSGDYWLIGLFWLLMTVSFEFLFFHFVGGKSWDELLADYNMAKGRIWVLVLATTLFGPPMIHAILRRTTSEKTHQ